ncbi:MAG: MaoC family dehydratase N-terminal domain-containing protein [Rhodospirillales bacterium]|nr:MaoC family dehydratase N-terminal domain-containing protein [Rhodospirillales bacterium]
MIKPDPQKIAAYRSPARTVSYGARETVLHALGLGLGADPVNRDELAFVYEEWGPKVVPSFASIIGHDTAWFLDDDSGVGDAPNVHGDETITFHKPLASEGTVMCQSRFTGLYDWGEGRHAILTLEDTVADAASGDLLVTLKQTCVLLGAGGFGGEPPKRRERATAPDRVPDHIVTRSVMPQAALLYRLSGDTYELHTDPAFARDSGFDGPILHGLATYGMACYAVVASCCAHDPNGLAGFHGRFTVPVYPGETLETVIWQDGSDVLHRTRSIERDVVVLDHGKAELC